jgi:hypothetical protein
MTTRTSIILTTMNVIFWVIFIGLCIKTGALLVSFFVSLFVNAAGAENLYLGLNFSELYRFGIEHYVFVVSLKIVLTALKTYIAYLVVKIFLQLNLANPFNTNVAALIAKISHYALGAGIVALLAAAYSEWLIKKGIPIAQNWGSSDYLFLAGIIFIIAQIFKKGIEIQTENELTI